MKIIKTEMKPSSEKLSKRIIVSSDFAGRFTSFILDDTMDEKTAHLKAAKEYLARMGWSLTKIKNTGRLKGSYYHFIGG